MSSITFYLKSVYQFVNEPQNKEAIKNTCSLTTFLLGCCEAWDISQECIALYRSRTITPIATPPPTWQQTAWRVTFLATRTSILLCGATSRPGVYLCRCSFGLILTPQQIERLAGGAATNFATNSSQLRHRVSLIAYYLGVPGALISCKNGCLWLRDKFTGSFTPADPNSATFNGSLFNFVTGRPTLHFVNQFCRPYFN